MKSLNKQPALIAIICAIGILIGSSISYGDVNSLKSEVWQGKVDEFTKQIEKKPNDASFYYDRAIAYAALGKLKEAIEDGTKAIQLNPKYSNAYINRGIDYIALGDYNQAMADFNKAIELRPKDATACYARGFAYHKLGKAEEADKDFAKSARLGYKGAQDFLKSKGYAVGQKAGSGASVPTEVVTRSPAPRLKPPARSTPRPQVQMRKPEVETTEPGMFMGVVGLAIGVVIYALFCLPLQVIAGKTNTPNGWFAWIPILNVVLMCKIAGKPIWWLILMLVPLINFAIIVIVWMKIAEKIGKPGWIGLLMMVPGVQLLVPVYLAFTK